MATPTIQSFGKYQILERIATGATAEIHKARLEGIGGFQRTFAIKRIRESLSRDQGYVASLVEEAKVAGLLSHANIVQIVDLGQVEDIWYIAMEYVDGRDLGAVLERAHQRGLRLPVPHAVFITIELLKGLEYAHQRRVMKKGKAVSLDIIHRDLSPPNVLLSFQGEVKLTDFGIARASHKALETTAELAKGRYDYMSPEQADGSPPLDQRSDLFTVGVLLYEMLTGHHPFRAGSAVETIDRLRQGSYVPVIDHNPEVPKALQRIVDKALAVDREARHESATALKEALDGFFHDSGFIFTHSTLSTYVQGLFPERARAPREPDDEGPTKEMSPVADSPTVAPPRSAPALSLEDLDDPDQETLIRKIPDGWDDDDPLGEALAQAPAKPTSAEGPRPAEAPEAPSPPNPNMPSLPSVDSAPAPASASSAEGARPRRAVRVQVVAWAFATASLVLGAGAGVLFTVLVGLLAGFRPVSADDPLLQPPRIHVLAPEGTTVRIDGTDVSTPAEVVPGERHEVEVTLQSGQRWTREIVLNRGEHSVLMFSDDVNSP